jgi:tRNA(fMet)-specific endonuclease VapC
VNYLLDTDTCIYLMTEREPKKRERIVTHLEAVKPEETVYLSSITVSELSYGAHKGKWSKANVALLERFLMDFTVTAFDEQAAKVCGSIRANLEKKGKPIGPLDTLIAAHAVSVSATLITNNTREFTRVSGLHVKNWSVA